MAETAERTNVVLRAHHECRYFDLNIDLVMGRYGERAVQRPLLRIWEIIRAEEQIYVKWAPKERALGHSFTPQCLSFCVSSATGVIQLCPDMESSYKDPPRKVFPPPIYLSVRNLLPGALAKETSDYRVVWQRSCFECFYTQLLR